MLVEMFGSEVSRIHVDLVHVVETGATYAEFLVPFALGQQISCLLNGS